MSIEITATIEREVTTIVTEHKTFSVRVDQFTVRTSGPDKGEIFGRSSLLDGDTVADAWDWVVPPSEVMPVVNRATSGAASLYAEISVALYAFPAVVTPPKAQDR